MTELHDLIRTELGVGDDSYYATPENMRNALLAVLEIPVPTKLGVAYAIAKQLDLIAEVTDS